MQDTMTVAQALENIDTPASLPDLLRMLAQMRRDQVAAEVSATAATVVLESTPEWAAYMEAAHRAVDIKNDISQLEDAIRAAGVDAFESGAGKRPAAGLEIKMFTRYQYNAALAEAWTRKEMPAILQWNAKAFERHAPDVAGAPIVILQEARCQIAKDLNNYLMDQIEEA